MLAFAKWLFGETLEGRTYRSATSRASFDARIGERHPCFQIIVLAHSRASDLERLLQSLEASTYTDCVELQIQIDPPESRDALSLVKHVADRFTFTHGLKSVTVGRVRRGLAASWRRAWVPSTDEECAIILEDDIVLSKFWFVWLKKANAKYGRRDSMAGISLQKQTLVPHKLARGVNLLRRNGPYMYRLVGSIGYSPKAYVWRDFILWWDSLPVGYDISTPGLVTSEWWRNLDQKHMWTQYFIHYTVLNSLYTLYAGLSGNETLAAHNRSKGMHFGQSLGLDFEPTTRADSDFPDNIENIGWSGDPENSNDINDISKSTLLNLAKQSSREHGGFIYLTFVNRSYLPLVVSWICNIKKVNPRTLQNTLFIVSDYSDARQLRRVQPGILVFVDDVGSESSPLDFNTYAYHNLLHRRLEVQNIIIQGGVNVMLVETDQIWSMRATKLDKLISGLFETNELLASDELQHAKEKQSLICGGFFGLKSTNKTRNYFQGIVEHHSNSLKAFKSDGFVNDQELMSREARKWNLTIFWLGPCVYSNGLWYDNPKRLCDLPMVLHNNWIIGNDKKIDRAKKHGHWYSNAQNTSCAGLR